MSLNNGLKVAEIVREAGGRIIGRTRLQKIVYLFSVTGLETGFAFSYKHYGPYSEDLAVAARQGSLLGYLSETEQTAAWGGSYSIYTVDPSASPEAASPSGSLLEARQKLAKLAASADAVELELAATAVFLAKEGIEDPWKETKRRKPEKAVNERVKGAKELLRQLRAIDAPVPLPTTV
ncbi:MAG TPA: hypothetical protein VEK34_12150 [Methylocella sp.]|nr:hypothetical protein [Methylocella sp.]